MRLGSSIVVTERRNLPMPWLSEPPRYFSLIVSVAPESASNGFRQGALAEPLGLVVSRVDEPARQVSVATSPGSLPKSALALIP